LHAQCAIQTFARWYWLWNTPFTWSKNIAYGGVTGQQGIFILPGKLMSRDPYFSYFSAWLICIF
jgi:hypothetical protein